MILGTPQRRTATRPRGAPRARVRAILLASLIGPAVLAAPGQAGTSAAQSGGTTEVPVTTSRGEFRLLVYRPAPLPAPRPDEGNPLILLVSGEGGWRGFDEMVAGYF